METILADSAFCTKFNFLCEKIQDKNEISTTFFYNVYKKNSDKIILVEGSEWYRFYTIDPDLVNEDCFRLFINCKNEYLELFLNELLKLCLDNRFHITQFKVTTYKYDNVLPRDPDADDRTQQHPVIIVYLDINELLFNSLRDYMLAKYSDFEKYKADNINIGTKRQNINGLFYWSKTTTTKIYNKYLKYKQKYLELKRIYLKN